MGFELSDPIRSTLGPGYLHHFMALTHPSLADDYASGPGVNADTDSVQQSPKNLGVPLPLTWRVRCPTWRLLLLCASGNPIL